jgi:hypothetical protein
MRAGGKTDNASLRCDSAVFDSPTAEFWSTINVPGANVVSTYSSRLGQDIIAAHRGNLIKQLAEWGIRSPDVPANVPPGLDIVANIREAKDMSASQFVDAVKSGGKWDFKRQGKEYEEFGNWHFGVVVRAWTLNAREMGLSQLAIDDFLLELAQRGAGYYQKRTQTSEPQWGSYLGEYPYGDDPRDSENIMHGWEIERLLEEPEADSEIGGLP